MNAYGGTLRWLAPLAVLLMVVAFAAACEGERTVVPSPTAVVPPTAVPLSTATPRPAPTPLPTPDVTAQTYAYASACSNITSKFNFTLSSFAGGLTWGALVELADVNIGGYSLLLPPPELETFNEAQIDLLTALRDRGLQERSDGVVIQDIAAALGGQLPAPGAQLDAATQQAMAGFFGPQFIQAFVAQQTAIGGLSSDLQALMAESNCIVQIG
ncbi:MAG: hypothetical protein OXC99_09765 [Chloroflexi bacterium]|nr:hypothetical protein [Chloroflexota bacterium]